MPRTKQSARPVLAKAPKRNLPCKAARKTIVRYSTHRDIVFETASECDIFEETFGDDYGRVSTPRKGIDRDAVDDYDDHESASRAKRPRVSLPSGDPDTPSMRLTQTVNLIESMESYILDIQDFLNARGLTSGAPVLPRDVAKALSIPDQKSAANGSVAPLSRADADDVAVQMKVTEIAREMAFQHDRLYAKIDTDESGFEDMEQVLRGTMQQIYELSKVESKKALMQALKLVTLLASNCISLPESPRPFPYGRHGLVLWLIEPADVLAKHCALKLWKYNWDHFVDWDYALEDFRTGSELAKKQYNRADYMQRTIDFIERVRGT